MLSFDRRRSNTIAMSLCIVGDNGTRGDDKPSCSSELNAKVDVVDCGRIVCIELSVTSE